MGWQTFLHGRHIYGHNLMSALLAAGRIQSKQTMAVDDLETGTQSSCRYTAATSWTYN